MAQVPTGNMEGTKRRYPIGVQEFETLREQLCIYVDKTQLIYQLVSSLNFCFLARPQGFGKSLLLSTLKAFFEGKKELFEGLIIETLEKDWTRYPILHMDFGETYYETRDELKHVLDEYLSIWEDTWPKRDNQLSQKPVEKEYSSIRLKRIIQSAHQQTGKRVVILIDGYDKPLLNAWNNNSQYSEIQTEMLRFFSPLKSMGSHMRFLFLTGIIKFRQLLDVTNLMDITLCDDFSTICGFTEEELKTTLGPDIDQLAKTNDDNMKESLQQLKKLYNGYNFSRACKPVYNPCSLFRAFSDKEYQNLFWFSNDMPGCLIKLLRETNFRIEILKNLQFEANDFDASVDPPMDPIAVLFQSGYLTIGKYLWDCRRYKLTIPNDEVRRGFLRSLLQMHVKPSLSDSTSLIDSFVYYLRNDDVSNSMKCFQDFLFPVIDFLNIKSEFDYHSILYLLFLNVGLQIETEVVTGIRHTDIVVKLDDAEYIFQFVFDNTPQNALNHIMSRPRDVAQELNKKVTKIGVNYSSSMRAMGFELCVCDGANSCGFVAVNET